MVYLPNASCSSRWTAAWSSALQCWHCDRRSAPAVWSATVDVLAVEPGHEHEGVIRGTVGRADSHSAKQGLHIARGRTSRRAAQSWRAGKQRGSPSPVRGCAAHSSAPRALTVLKDVRQHGAPRQGAINRTQENFVSKNVAVFVDVANIFYAAKAAGVDIDYVTLLKSATAGRDFVRAYAYTGLDPENDNQRQFHAFLARNGYKVISKDIRKYGDGRIKANLDIELVVDMMKTARNLDIAVVVSGDGDFATAIRAVQEMGVRVEVISFRGNTS